jgi:hypothetical protein
VTVVRAVESFVCPDGSVGTGDLLDSSDPLVKGREHLFEDIKVPERQDILMVATDKPPEETDSESSIEAAEVGSEAREDKKPVRRRRST